ncbi:MAG: hypothetical protein OEL84_07710 [Nitrosopumilus sp.]|nr:hypothetical protein [Nitrosopumilus sp.]
MKTRLLIITVLVVSPFVISEGFGMCLVNEDWYDVPCLDEVINGRYVQTDVNRWAEYYQHKGTVVMDEKRSELEQAVKDGNLQNWINESDENSNVYDYYFFSGRAPNIGKHYAEFEEFMINESSTIHDPYVDDERYQLALKKIPTGGFGIDPQFNMLVTIAGILAGSGLTVGLLLFWRKRK